MINQFKITATLDKFAVSTSTLCAIHCLALPLLIGVFPVLGTTIFGYDRFHEVLLWAVVPMTVISLTLGCKKHKSLSTALLGVVGLTILIVAVILGHESLTVSSERILTLIGVSVVALAHIRNYKLCRRLACDC